MNKSVHSTPEITTNDQKLSASMARWRRYFWFHLVVVVGFGVFAIMDLTRQYCLLGFIVATIVAFPTVVLTMIGPLVSLWMAWSAIKRRSPMMLLFAIVDMFLSALHNWCLMLVT